MKTGDSYIFRAVGSFLFFVINVFAVYLLLRGHNLPGGGFIGGLGSALSLIMLSLAFGVREAQKVLRVDPTRLAAIGLLLAVVTGMLPLVVGEPFLRHFHWKLEELPLLGTLEVGTPLIFDIGIFLVVVGVTAKMIFVLFRSISGLTALNPSEWRRYAADLEEPVEREHSRSSSELETEDEP
ncbi:MAG TPA: MnhB domain-containing protein [Opitutaceae bacterium]|nr:MnhB domain-containing protein [Opitutaceae bacterium]HRJ46154.1 MnhB domain-containing protein [Opitutaceae bacterium]